MKYEGEVNMILDFCRFFNERNCKILEKFVLSIFLLIFNFFIFKTEKARIQFKNEIQYDYKIALQVNEKFLYDIWIKFFKGFICNY
jgi:hypothetical protein